MKQKTLSLQSKATMAYLMASLVSKGISALTVPIFTRILSTSQIGITTTYSSWNAILYPIATLSLCSGSLNIAMMEFKEERDKYQAACLTLTTLSTITLLCIYILFSNFWDQFTTLSSPLMIVMLTSFIFSTALDLWFARQRYEYNYKGTVIISVSSVFLSTIVCIICVIIAKYNNFSNLGEIKIVSQTFVMMGFGIFFYFYIFIKGRCFYDKRMWIFGLKVSLPLIVHTLAKSILDMSDRLMIASICGQEAAGIYGTIYTISTMSLIIWSAINVAMIPFVFENLEDRAYKKINRTVMLVLSMYGIVSICITLAAPEIVQILATKEYYEAVYLIPPISAGIYLTALYNIYGNFLMFKKKTIHIMVATLITGILNLILNYIFIHTFGYAAAAYTTLFCFIILSIMQGIMQRRVYKENIIEDKKIFALSSVIVIVCLAVNFIYNFLILRYIIIVCLIGILIVNRKKI